MNELIERFIAESTICQGHPQIDGSYFDKEKFAKLIVRETLNEMGEQMYKFGDDQSNNPTWYKSMEVVEKRFGVKEMNERIRELAKESGLIQYDSDNKMQDVKKFAELILRECSQIIANAVDHREPASTYVNKIQKHFGVDQ